MKIVLILVLMEYEKIILFKEICFAAVCLNPCFNGIRKNKLLILFVLLIAFVLILVLMEYEKIQQIKNQKKTNKCLNPCFNGIRKNSL